MSSRFTAVLERARAHYLAQPFMDHEETRIKEKYRALAQMVRKRSQPGDAEWKGLVVRFPGCLREAEMCRVSTIAQRAQYASSIQEWIGAPRHELLADRRHRTLLVWEHLHGLLRDLQAWRSLPDSVGQGIEEFWKWTQSTESRESCGLWPATSGLLRANAAGRPDQHTAYQWMAELLGISQAALLEELLDRLGARRGHIGPGPE